MSIKEDPLREGRAELILSANDYTKCLPFEGDMVVKLAENDDWSERDEQYLENIEKIEAIFETPLFDSPILGGTWEVDQEELMENKSPFVDFWSRRNTSRRPLTDILMSIADYDLLGGGHSDPEIREELGILEDGIGGPKL